MELIITPNLANLFDDFFNNLRLKTTPTSPMSGAISSGKPWSSWNGVIFRNQLKINSKTNKDIVKVIIPNILPVF